MASLENRGWRGGWGVSLSYKPPSATAFARANNISIFPLLGALPSGDQSCSVDLVYLILAHSCLVSGSVILSPLIWNLQPHMKTSSSRAQTPETHRKRVGFQFSGLYLLSSSHLCEPLGNADLRILCLLLSPIHRTFQHWRVCWSFPFSQAV